MPDLTIRVQFFALLREQAGRSDETLTTGARDAREL
jgi:molybdopterin converting factor small subunit